MTVRRHAFQIGAISAMVIADGTRYKDLAHWQKLFRADADAAAVEEAYSAYRTAGNNAEDSLNVLYLKVGAQQILVDTGFGDHSDEQVGHLRQHLQAEGIQPEDINTVILTHGHPDHLYGVCNAAGELLYPNASFFMSQVEHQHWQQASTREKLSPEVAEALQQRYAAIKERLTLVPMDADLAMGVRALPLPGHSPGHIGLMVESQGERLLHLVDAIHHPIQAQQPHWSPAFDHDPDTARESRRPILGRAADEGLLVLTYHFSFPGLGYFQREGEAFRWAWASGGQPGE